MVLAVAPQIDLVDVGTHIKQNSKQLQLQAECDENAIGEQFRLSKKNSLNNA